MKTKNFLIFTISFFIAVLVLFNINLKKEMVKSKIEPEAYAFKTERGDDPIARAEFEFNMLKDPKTGKIPAGIRERELKYAQTLPRLEGKDLLLKGNRVQGLSWASRGPVNQGGRTRALAIDVANENNILAGGVSGGMWRSTDGGVTWVKTSNNNHVLQSVSCIVQDTRSGHTDTWYYGTGEYTGNSASGGASSSFYNGQGVFKSTDNGLTWNQLVNTAAGSLTVFDNSFDFLFNIAIDKSRTDSAIVYTANYSRIKRSNDGGNTWTTPIGGSSGSYSDLAVTSTGVVYAALASNSSANAGLWRSPDGINWTNITPSTWPTTYKRTVIGIAPSNPNIVYFLAETPGTNQTEHSVWKYTYPGSGSGAGDANWIDRSTNLPALGGLTGNFDSQGSYDLVIKVKPNDENFVVFGGTNLFKTTDGFQTAVGATNWIGGYTSSNNSYALYPNHHPDQHSLVFFPSNPKMMLSGNDGGIKKTTDVTGSPTVVWADKSSGYQTSQFYSIALDHGTNGNNILVGGLQDNGTYFTNSTNAGTSWLSVNGGDGAFAAIADGRSSYYVSSQQGTIYRQLLDDTGSYTQWAYVTPSGASNFLFIPPYILDPNNTDVMYLTAGTDVWRNSDLTQIPLFSNNKTSVNWTDLTNTNNGNTITTVAASKTPANIVYYGNNAGQVFRIDNANTGNPVPVNITGGSFPSGGYARCIAVNRTDANKIMVVFSNYGVESLFYSSNATNATPTWTAVGGNLEPASDGPSVRWAEISNFGGTITYFVATSIGLYSTTTLNGSSTVWSQEGSSIVGNNVCVMIDHRELDGLVVAATHGGGVFSATQVAVGIESESSSIPTSYAVSQNYPNPFNPSTKIKFALPSPEKVQISIYDITGRKVKDLLNQNLTAGTHTVDFDAADLASGTYIYRIIAGSFVQSKKMVLLK